MDAPQTLEEKDEFFRKQFDQMDRQVPLEQKSQDPNDITKEKSETPVVKTKAEINSENIELEKESKEKIEEFQAEEKKEDFPKPKIIQSKVNPEKEKQRTENLLKGFEEKKQAFYKEKADFESQKKSFQEQLEKQVREEYKKKRPDIVSITPEIYMKMAEDAKANGDYDKADEYRAQAYQLKEELKAFNEEETKAEQSQKEYQTKIAAHREKVVQQIQETYPEINKLDSSIRKHLDQICTDNDLNTFFNTHPNGYYYAAHVANLSHQAELVPALVEEVKSLKSQLKDMHKKSSPATSFDNGGMKQKSINQMSLEDKDNYYARSAAEADRFVGVG